MFYMMGIKGGEGTYTFAKLKGTENYKEWAREISFALRDADLISYASGTAVRPDPYTKKERGSVSEEKFEKREADIEKWILNDSRTGGKIGKMSGRQRRCRMSWSQSTQRMGGTRNSRSWIDLKRLVTLQVRIVGTGHRTNWKVVKLTGKL